MTVKELIKTLREHQENAELYIWADTLDGSVTRYDIIDVDPNTLKSRVDIRIKTRGNSLA